MSGSWNDRPVDGDEGRPALDEVALNQTLAADGWSVRVLQETDSTQAEAHAAIARGADAGLAVIAEYQIQGRGRRDRSWLSPARSGITMSMVLRPKTISPWVGVAVALGAVEAVNSLLPAADVRLKWPNDLVFADPMRKVGGLIAEVAGDLVVVGIGLNVSTTAAELSDLPDATSLRLMGMETDRSVLITEILRTVGQTLGWNSDRLRARYLEHLDTIGKAVRITTPDGQVEGVASSITDEGHLVVDGQSFAVGDVIHLRDSQI